MNVAVYLMFLLKISNSLEKEESLCLFQKQVNICRETLEGMYTKLKQLKTGYYFPPLPFF